MASFVLFAVFQFCTDAFYFGIIPFRIFQKEIQEDGTHGNLLLDKFLPPLVNCNGHVFLLCQGIVTIIRDHLTTHERLDPDFRTGLPIIQVFILVKVGIQMRLVCDHFQDFVTQAAKACVGFPSRRQRLLFDLPDHEDETKEVDEYSCDGEEDFE